MQIKHITISVAAALAIALSISGCGDEAATTTCTNGVQDEGESGVDCGGSCKSCDAPPNPCDNGVLDPDEEGIDCGGTCIPCGQAPTCVDGFRNQGETGVDCGGPCPACASGPACDNGVMDGDETGVDCGGSCPACGAAPTCTDGVRNQGESDVDCGGPCSPCATGKACRDTDDCETNICTNDVCTAPAATCSDGVRSGDESDVDCGGSCPGCEFDEACGEGGDCRSGVCTGDRCADPTCTDNIRNGFESDVDCGPGCDPCQKGERCAFGADCASGACGDGICVSCDDGVRNANETDTDCGGDVCAPCGGGDSCIANRDCAGGLCEIGICVSCDNGRRDGDESDVDCGGSCAPCEIGAFCNGTEDCNNGTCGGGRCVGASCVDQVKNGDETDVDCGGSCAPCGLDMRCTNDDGCLPAYACDTQSSRCEEGYLEVIAAGDGFTCILNDTRSEVFCWGDNSYGQLGTGDTNPRSRPVKVQNLPPADFLAVGARHACIITNDDRVFCWGDNAQGQCGDGTSGGNRLVPVEVPGLTPTYGELDLGASHSCAIRDTGTLACWGANSRGQLGTGNTSRSLVPVSPVNWSTRRVRNLSAGGANTCVVLGDNQGGNSREPFCWGDNTHFQMGYQGLTSYEDEPELMTNDDNTRHVVGGENLCRVKSDGIASCFGYGGATFGVFGRESYSAFECAPVGPRCCAALSDEDGARCWSGNDGGHRTEVPNLARVVRVGVGLDHVCYRGEGVSCHGANDRGQLGRGTVGGDDDVVRSVAGFVEPSCTNGVHDFNEDGVDCGGSTCTACVGGSGQN